MSDAAWLEIPDFVIRIAAPVAFWNFIFSDILIIKHVPFQIFLLEGKKKDSLSNCCLFRRRYFYYGV